MRNKKSKRVKKNRSTHASPKLFRVYLELAGREWRELHPLEADALHDEVIRHLHHELLGSADVVLGRTVIEVDIIGVNGGEVNARIILVVDADELGLGESGLEDVDRDGVGPRLLEAPDVVLERHITLGSVNERDGPVGLVLDDGVENGDHGRDTDAGRDEDERHANTAVGVEEDLAGRVGDVELVTPLEVVEHDVGHEAGVDIHDHAGLPHLHAAVPLDGNPVVIGPGGIAEGVLPNLDVALVGHLHLHRNILAGQELGEGLAILGSEVERVDVIRLPDLLGNLKLPPAFPPLLLEHAVHLVLATDEHAGENPVGLVPSETCLGGHGGAEDLAEGVDEVLADDLVVFGFYAERAVLVAHALEPGDQLADVVDVGGEPEDDGREGAGLAGVGDVDIVEDVVELGVGLEHVVVEGCGDAFSMVLEGWDGRPDYLRLLV